MASDVEGYGAGRRVIEGEENHLIWVPLSSAEIEDLKEKVKSANVDVRYLVANLLRGWMTATPGPELSVADLDRVVGGLTTTFSTLDVTKLNYQSTLDASKMQVSTTTTTLMCW